jgi:Zn-dependent metalloprotease
VSIYGKSLGLPDATQLVVTRAEGPDEVGMEHVRLQQTHRGIPVTAGIMTVHLRGASIVAIHAKTLPELGEIDVSPRVPTLAALSSARDLIAVHYGIDDPELSAPRLEFFNRGLVEGVGGRTHLAWFVEARGLMLLAYLWVDAHSGQVLFHVNQVADALNRQIYDGMSLPALPGTLVRSEGDPPSGDTDVDQAYNYTGDTYDYFLTEHGRDSYDGAGATMMATIRSCPSYCGCPCSNAYWAGSRTLFGAGWAIDDIGAMSGRTA